MSEVTATSVVIEAAADAPIALPNDPSYLTAEYFRDGENLVIQTADGGTTVVSGYFGLEAPVDLLVAGAAVSGKVVSALARPAPEGAEGADVAAVEADASGSAYAAETASTEAGQPIGKIGEVSGEAFAKRADGTIVELKAGDPVFEDDLLFTASDSSMGVVFTDGMTFSLGAEARMLLDEFRFDEAAHEGGGLFSVLAGEFSFVSGAAAHTAEDALMIETPTMTIGVRGTKVVSQIDADGVSRVALLAEEDGTVGKIMVMTDAGEELIDAANKMVEITDRSAPPSAQQNITAADVVRFFGEAVGALPAPYEFFEPKAHAPNAAPESPFAAGFRARAEADEAALEAEVAQGDAAAETSFAERAAEIAQQSAASTAGAEPLADFTVVMRSLLNLAEEIAAADPEAFLEALEALAEANALVEEALAEARATAEAYVESVADAAQEIIDLEEEQAEAAAAAPPEDAAVAADEDVADTATIYDAGNGGSGYALADDHGGLFEIDAATGVISLASGQSLDFEALSSYRLTVNFTSAGGHAQQQIVDVTVNDVNDTAQVFTSETTASAAESEGDAAAIYTATVTDADTTGEAIAFSLTDDAGGLFEIDAATGVVTLATGQSLDYETATSHNITIRSSDGVNTSDHTVTVSVTDQNDVGQVFTSATTASAAESVGDAAAIYTATVTDADTTGEAIAFSLTDDAGGLFEIDAATGVVTLATGQSLDYETATSYNITIRSSDGVNTTDRTVTISVNDANEFAVAVASDVDGAANIVCESAANGATVGVTASANDADGSNNTVTYSLSDDAGGRFAIDSATGVVTVADGTLIDYELAASHMIEVTATSADGSTSTQNFTINVADYTQTSGGSSSDDTLTGTNNDDVISGGDGDDVISGGNGQDTLNGDAGNDTLTGGNAADVLNGGTGNDTLNGQNGADTLTGGDGNDIIDGGDGPDTAVYSSNYADYTISYNSGTATFSINGPDGNDTVTNVETFQFADQTLSASAIIADVTSNAAPTLGLASGIDFDGMNDYVAVGDPGAGSDDLDIKTGDQTVEFWFYYDGSTTGSETFVSKTESLHFSEGFKIGRQGGDLYISLQPDVADPTNVAATSVQLTTPGWHHVAMVVNQEAGAGASSVTGYLDGSSAGWTPGFGLTAGDTFTAPAGGIDTTMDFVIGGVDTIAVGIVDKSQSPISDVRVWDVARSGAEIQSTMTQSLDGTESGLVANWKLDEAGGDAAMDGVGGYTGAVYGAPSWIDTANLTVSAGDTLAGRLVFEDADGDALTLSETSGPSHGSVTLDATTGAWEYTADGGYSGADSFSYQVADGNGGVDTLTIAVTVI